MKHAPPNFVTFFDLSPSPLRKFLITTVQLSGSPAELMLNVFSSALN